MPSVISTHFSLGYMVPVDLLSALCTDYPHVIGINCSIGQDFTYLVRVLDEVPAPMFRPRRPEPVRPTLRLLRKDVYAELARRRRRAQIAARHELEKS